MVIVGVRLTRLVPYGNVNVMFVPRIVPSTPLIVNCVMSFALLSAMVT